MKYNELPGTPICFIIENNELTPFVNSNDLEVISDNLDELGKSEAEICILPVIKLVRKSDEDIEKDDLRKLEIQEYNNALFEKQKNSKKS